MSLRKRNQAIARGELTVDTVTSERADANGEVIESTEETQGETEGEEEVQEETSQEDAPLEGIAAEKVNGGRATAAGYGNIDGPGNGPE